MQHGLFDCSFAQWTWLKSWKNLKTVVAAAGRKQISFETMGKHNSKLKHDTLERLTSETYCEF